MLFSAYEQRIPTCSLFSRLQFHVVRVVMYIDRAVVWEMITVYICRSYTLRMLDWKLYRLLVFTPHLQFVNTLKV